VHSIDCCILYLCEDPRVRTVVARYAFIMATYTVHDGESPHEGHTWWSASWSEQGVEEFLASGAWGLWLLRLLRLDAFLLEEFLPADGLGVGVKAEEDTLVDQWVLVLSPRALGNLGVGRSDNSLDHGTVDDASDIWVGDLGSRENIVLLVDGSLVESTEDLIEKAECALSPDNEPAEVATRSKLEQV